MKIGTISATAAAFALAGGVMAQDQVLLVPDSTNDVIASFDPFDGSLIDPVFIDLVPLGAGTPKGVAQVGNEIWVSDQLRDRVDRFTLDGDYIDFFGGQVPDGGLDNVRGVNVIGDEVWVFNAGSNNGAPGNAIVRVDPTTATIIGNIPLGASPWFALPYNGEVLVTIDDQLDRYDDAGNFLGQFFAAGQLNFLQQTSEMSSGNVLVGAFSSPSGIWEISIDGGLLGVILGTADSGARAGWELGNGSIMWTNGDGVNVTDPVTGATVNVLDGNGQFIAMLGEGERCYPDFDGDGQLTIFDFLAFQNAFDSGDLIADCDEDGSLTLFDFLCFQNAFDAGCE
ncbi:MAG: GC-type dockerin domain-anchored protein [Phycisphaerales bacterium JB064]